MNIHRFKFLLIKTMQRDKIICLKLWRIPSPIKMLYFETISIIYHTLFTLIKTPHIDCRVDAVEAEAVWEKQQLETIPGDIKVRQLHGYKLEIIIIHSSFHYHPIILKIHLLLHRSCFLLLQILSYLKSERTRIVKKTKVGLWTRV